MMKNFLRKFFVALFLFVAIFPQNFSALTWQEFFNRPRHGNLQKLVPAGHWVYDAIDDIFFDCGKNTFATQSAPLAIAELQLYLKEIEYDALSDYAKKQYDRVFHYFEGDRMLFSSSVISFGANMLITPELYYKSNDEIKRTDRYYFKDNILSLPVYFSITDYIFMESYFSFGKNYWAAQSSDNYFNMPINFNGKTSAWEAAEFDWPRTAYLSFGIPFKDTAFFNFKFGRGSKSIGNTQFGSIIMSPDFETDFYSQISFFAPNIKYTLDLTQVDTEKYMYSHRIEFRLFKKLNVTLLESAYVAAPFELKYLNPLMVLHAFSPWHLYPENDLRACAYIAAALDFTPTKYWHVYALYAQNEITAPSETNAALPNSMGWQAGIKTTIPLKTGALKSGIEAIYTMPWLYIKHTPDNSLVRLKHQETKPTGSPSVVTSWMGTSFGPDTIAVSLRAGYEVPTKWSAFFSYNFLIQGSNAFSDNVFVNKNGYKKDISKEDENYYPDTLPNKEEGEKKAAWITAFHGPEPAQFTNRFTVESSYIFTSHFSAAAKLSYAFIFNNRNILNNTQHGVELALSGTFKLFD